MTDFVARGGVWVAVQFAWFAAIIGIGWLDLAVFTFSGQTGVGWALVLAAVALGGAAALSLGRNLTPYPKPVDSGTLVARGPYRLVRHPIYTAVILGMIGIAVRGGDWISLALAFGLVPFFYAKSSYEERHLTEEYPGYESYRHQVPHRLLPGIL